MNNEFDELAKGLAAQSVTRRGALKKFGVSLAGFALASLGLANKADAALGGFPCSSGADCGGLGLSLPACCQGRCVDLDWDSDNCGACRHRCSGNREGKYCIAGTCSRKPYTGP